MLSVSKDYRISPSECRPAQPAKLSYTRELSPDSVNRSTRPEGVNAQSVRSAYLYLIHLGWTRRFPPRLYRDKIPEDRIQNGPFSPLSPGRYNRYMLASRWPSRYTILGYHLFSAEMQPQWPHSFPNFRSLLEDRSSNSLPELFSGYPYHCTKPTRCMTTCSHLRYVRMNGGYDGKRPFLSVSTQLCELRGTHLQSKVEFEAAAWTQLIASSWNFLLFPSNQRGKKQIVLFGHDPTLH
ncbi:hypothetical protein HD806DRAFT_303577 [Xylariaceae sp. AK1471]|nr:hypothetical protein HD806DRAFT_303577 [Xylariaceae sp. AK1471]